MIDRLKHRFGRSWARRDLSALKYQTPRPVDVAIDSLLIGNQSGRPLERWIPATGEVARASNRLLDSPYVSFLRLIRENPRLLEDSEALRSTDYYSMAKLCQEHTGRWFGARTEDGLLSRLKAYGNMLPELGGTGGASAEPDGDEEVKGRTAPGEAVKVFKVRESSCYELVDGHHRSALAAMESADRLPVEVLGEKWTYLQQLVLKGVQTRGRKELYQPVNAPEFDGSWKLVRKCSDRFELMKNFLRDRQIDGKDKTALDIACSYGWFLSQFAGIGFTPAGVERDFLSIRIGQAAYKLPKNTVREMSAEKLLKHSGERSDIVLFLSILHHYAIGRERVGLLGNWSRPPVDLILERLDSITGAVLFLDTGQESEEWFKSKLPGWTPKYIAELLKEKTSFKEVVALGTDEDAASYPGNYGRTLFACVR